MNKCNLVGDLLPLYVENLLSEDSKTIVERHLARCPACAEKAKRLALPEPAPEPEAELPTEEKQLLKKTKRKFRKRTALITVGCVLLSSVIVFCGAAALPLDLIPYEGWDWKFSEDNCFNLKEDIEVPFIEPSGETATYTFKTNVSASPMLTDWVAHSLTISSPEGLGFIFSADYTMRYYSIFEFFDGLSADEKRNYSEEEQEAERALYHFCKENGLYNHVEIADAMIRFRLDDITSGSSNEEKALARALRQHRSSDSFAGTWSEILGITVKKDYHRLTGALDGYALLGNEWTVFFTTEKYVYKLVIRDDNNVIGNSTEKLAALLGTIRAD